jgi:hypothetical protein
VPARAKIRTRQRGPGRTGCGGAPHGPATTAGTTRQDQGRVRRLRQRLTRDTTIARTWRWCGRSLRLCASGTSGVAATPSRRSFRHRPRGGRHRGANHPPARCGQGRPRVVSANAGTCPETLPADGPLAGRGFFLSPAAPRQRRQRWAPTSPRVLRFVSAEPEKPGTRRAASIAAQPRPGKCGAMAPLAGRGTDAAPGRKISGGRLDVRG